MDGWLPRLKTQTKPNQTQGWHRVVDPANLLALLSGNWPVSSSITGSFDAVGCYGLS